MNQREVGADRFPRLAGVAKNSFRVPAKADSADPFAMFEVSWGNCLGVLGGQYRTIGAVQNLCGRGAKQCPTEEAGVGRHDDEIKIRSLGRVDDLSSCIARQQDSRTLLDGELGLQERVQFVTGKALVLFGNLGEWPHIELGRVAIVEIEDVNKCDAGPEDSLCPLQVGAIATQDAEKSRGNRMFELLT